MQEIRFYHEYDDYGYFSNYWVAPITVEEKVWPSSEHYYQSCKSLDHDFRERIRTAATPDDAKNLGNSEECVYRTDWDTYKDNPSAAPEASNDNAVCYMSADRYDPSLNN